MPVSSESRKIKYLIRGLADLFIRTLLCMAGHINYFLFSHQLLHAILV